MENETMFEIETLQDWQFEAHQIVDEPVGGASNSNSSNNSADEP
jgi:hypothetical protein